MDEIFTKDITGVFSTADVRRIVEEIDLQLNQKGILLIAIEGRSASGKTTLANTLSKYYDCNVYHMDDFFLPPYRKTKKRLMERGGNVDYEAVECLILDILKAKPFSYSKYDCSTNGYTREEISPKVVNIIEGTYSLHPNLFGYYDIKVYLDVDKDEQLKRLKERCPEKLDKYINEWLPLEEKYFEV